MQVYRDMTDVTEKSFSVITLGS